MIASIRLSRFKCFGELRLPLSRLTLLSGLNASGKSSALQALILLHQTMREHPWSDRLILNGRAVRLGRVGDVIDQASGGRECGLVLEDGGLGEVAWSLRGDPAAASMEVDSVVVMGPGRERHRWLKSEGAPLRNLLPEAMAVSEAGSALAGRLRDMTWLSAERLGPRDLYELSDPGRRLLVGRAGEGAAGVLHHLGDEPVLEALRVPSVPPTLARQTEAHMSQFFPGFDMELSGIPRTNALTLGVRTSWETDYHRPGHTGFGVTQALPIVVAVLAAQLGDMLLIENPEVHLHPAGQARMGEFLAEAAAAGVQVLVESHSDHVLNGIRRAVKKGSLGADETAVYFFRPRHEAKEAKVAQVESMSMDEAGDIDHWPAGFFDQFDRDMNTLAGWD